MAVYDNPTYKHQSLYRVNGFVCLRTNSETVTIPDLPQFPKMGQGSKLMVMSALGIVNHLYAGPVQMGRETEESIFVKRMLDQGRTLKSRQDLQFHRQIGNAMSAVLSRAESWSSHHAAVQHLLGHF
jgi:hypothetical protein